MKAPREQKYKETAENTLRNSWFKKIWKIKKEDTFTGVSITELTHKSNIWRIFWTSCFLEHVWATANSEIQ